MTRKSNQYNRIRKQDADEQRAKHQAKRAARHGGSSGSQPRTRIYRDTQSAPTSLMGGIIGKGGAHIKTIVADAGPSCRIWSDKDKAGTFQITAPSQDTIARAKQLIRSKIRELQAQDLQRGLLQNQKGSIRERRHQARGDQSAHNDSKEGFQLDRSQFPSADAKPSETKSTEPPIHTGAFSALVEESESESEAEVEETPSTTKPPQNVGSWVKPLQLQTQEEVVVQAPKPTSLVRQFTGAVKAAPMSPLVRSKLAPMSSWGDDDDETPWDERDESQMPSLLPVDEAVWA